MGGLLGALRQHHDQLAFPHLDHMGPAVAGAVRRLWIFIAV